MREERWNKHPVTIPYSNPKPHKPTRSPRPAVRPGPLPTGTTLALILVFLMAAVVGSITWAYFSDTATTTATFSSGTVDLLICHEEGEEENEEESCYSSLVLPEMANIYPGWSQTVTLGLKNIGSLRMRVVIQALQVEDQGDLGGVVRVVIYKAASPDTGGLIWPLDPIDPTLNALEEAEPVEYGVLEPDSPQPVTFVFTWPETAGDQSGLSGKYMNEQINFTGTTEGVVQD